MEDNEAVRTLLVTVLEKLGYGIHSVGDGHAAIAYVESEAEVDLLLSDILLPNGMNGIELGRRIRTLRPDIRVLYFSGHAEDNVLRLAKDDPDFVLLSKPFERRVLAQRIRETLGA